MSRAAVVLNLQFITVEMHHECRSSFTEDSEEDAAVSGHLIAILNSSLKNELISKLVPRHQLFLQEVAKVPAVLAVNDVEASFWLTLEPVSFAILDDLIVEHRERVAASLLAPCDIVMPSLRNLQCELMHLLSCYEDWMAENIVDGVNHTVVHNGGQWLLPEEVILVQQGARVILPSIVDRIEVTPGVALLRIICL